MPFYAIKTATARTDYETFFVRAQNKDQARAAVEDPTRRVTLLSAVQVSDEPDPVMQILDIQEIDTES